MIAIGSYANRVLRKEWPELSSGPDDRIWVIIRNPRLLPDGELASAYDGVDLEDGKRDRVALLAAGNKVAAKLVIAARVYDATYAGEFDPATGEPVPGTEDQPLLPPTPWTPEIAAKLPGAITQWIGEQLSEAASPKQDSEPSTPKT